MKNFLLFLSIFLFIAVPGFANDAYRVDVLDQAPPAEIAEPIRNELQMSAIRVLKGNDPLCEIWLRKRLPVEAPKGLARSYPQLPDMALLGGIRVTGNMTDNRNNSFPKGFYTIRHGLQPQDGNHVGSSEFVDFALLLNAKNDKTVDGGFATPRAMINQSMSDGGAGHPIVFALVPASSKPQPRIAINNQDRWVLEAKAGDTVLAMVLVGVYEH